MSAAVYTPKAPAGLGISFQSENRSVPTSPCPSRYFQTTPTVQAVGTPTTVVYQALKEELQEQLQRFYSDRSTIDSAQIEAARSLSNLKLGTSGSKPQLSIMASIEDGEASSSVSESAIFKILYLSNNGNLQHFADTKLPLPFQAAASNGTFISWIAAKEPGLRTDPAWWRSGIRELEKDTSSLANSQQLVTFTSRLLQAHRQFIDTGIRFTLFDLYCNMLKNYYCAKGDVKLIRYFPITDGNAFHEYVEQSKVVMQQANVLARQQHWTVLSNEWQKAATALRTLKDSAECARRYNHMQTLKIIFERSPTRDERRKRLQSRSRTRVEKRKAVKQANLQRRVQQMGELGRHPLANALVTAIHDVNTIHNREYVSNPERDEELPQALRSMSLEHPDSLSRIRASSACRGPRSDSV